MGSISDNWNNSFKRSVLLMVVSAVALVLSFFGITPMEWFDLVWMAIVLCGLPIILRAMKRLVINHDIRAGMLVSLVIIASVLLQEYFAAGEVASII